MQPSFHLHARRRRSTAAAAFLVLVLGWLIFSFYQTQVLKNTSYALQSDANRLRPIPVPAPRGTILDRNGEIVAENVPGYALSLLPAPADSLRSRLDRLAPILELDPDRVEWLIERQRRSPHQPMLVSADLSFEQISAVQERRLRFPGILIDTRPKRRYPAGAAIGHLVGYLSEINEQELTMPEFEGYSPRQHVGKAGLERQYERILAGRPGERYIEVDALGRAVADFAPQSQVPAVPGEDLHLFVDLGLQEYMARIFPEGMRGAMAAVEPRTGHVLALYSAPAFDPNDFVGGIPAGLWTELNKDPARPMLPRATAGLYPPGSTFKLVTAAAALELGVLNPEGYLPVPCRGGMSYGNRYFNCWREYPGHGALTLPEAISQSCNVYFYQVGIRVGLARFLTEASRLGFSSRTGIDLPTEAAGIFPSDLDWYRRRWGWGATETEVLFLAIGQGPTDQTPLNMARFYAALAGDGTLGPLRLVDIDAEDPGGGLDLGLSPETLGWLRKGLRQTVAPGGTAFASSLQHWELSGKTGTAQNPHGASHGWFVGMAGPWGEEPEVVVAAIVEAGERGSDVAQLVAKAADHYLRRAHGIPVDTIQTYREHLLAGRPAPWANR